MGAAQAVRPVVPIDQRGYAHPEVLVSTEWAAAHLTDPKVRLIESNEDILLYDTGHIPGAVKLDWTTDLNDPVVRDYIDRERLQKLLSSKGINDDTTIVFYGDKNNWWATYALWVFSSSGTNAKILDGGRMRWVDEGRKLTTDAPTVSAGQHQVRPSATTRRSAHSARKCSRTRQEKGQLVDVRSPEEFRGERCTCPSTRRRAACGAATFRGPRAFRGPRR